MDPKILAVISRMMKYLLLTTLVGSLQAVDKLSMACQMAKSCLQQTCQVRDGSAWWIVNCSVEEDNCSQTLEDNNIIHSQISCKPCYNMQCHSCSESWEGCKQSPPEIELY